MFVLISHVAAVSNPQSTCVPSYPSIPRTIYNTVRYDIYIHIILVHGELSSRVSRDLLCTRPRDGRAASTAAAPRQNLIVNALRTTGARRFRSWPTLCFVRLIIRQKGTYYRRHIATETPPPPRKRYALTTSQTDGVQIFIIIILYYYSI